MLDMGFMPDVRRILGRLPRQRQNLLFSATMPPAILAFARDILHDPVTLQVERVATPATGITHAAYPVPAELKSLLLLELLKRPDARSVLAFTRTKHRANRVAEFLMRHGVRAERIHGNRSQAQRTQALAGFKDGRYQVLVATDIAARGIDVVGVSHVVNFDVPNLPEDYIHRVGRTARADALGDAVTLVAPDEEQSLRAIEQAVRTRLPRMKLPGFDYARRSQAPLEIPLAERLAAMRAQRRSGHRSAPARHAGAHARAR
jgi:ATP-dependent RNA helicase RhlE